MFKQCLQLIMGVFLVSAVLLGQANAAKANYPDKPITLVVPFAPGGATDLLGRLIAQKVGEKLGQTVVVENRPGAGTMIGATAVARKPADGYTLLITASGFLINPSIRTDVPYDTIKDFSLVTSVAEGPLVLVVNPSVPAKTLPEFIEYAKAHPGKLTFGSSGIGGGSHLAVELLKSMAQVDLLHIPYGGSGPAAMALISGQTSLGIDAATLYLSYIKSGKVRALAVTSKNRFSLLPDVPTISESGYPDYLQRGWWGILARSGTPKEIMKKLNETIVDVLATNEVKTFLKKEALEVLTNTPEEAAIALETYVNDWTKVIKTVGVEIK
ncbi:MAG: Bug family tripartite tricarboxylate transporter substrate binding protein [Advenella sp.]